MTKKTITWTRLFSRYSSMFDLIFICLVILVLAITGSVWKSYSTNSETILGLTEELISQVNTTISEKTTNYLVPAPVMTELGARITGDQVDRLTDSPELNGLMMEVLKLHSQLAIFSIGNENGDFLMHTKEADGSISTKIIDASADEPRLIWVRRDIDGNIISRQEQAWDGFDPRKRTWYQGAKDTGVSYWSDVYIFHTSQAPGITSSFPVKQNGKVVGVFGLDIPLKELSDFVARQKVGTNGATFLLNSNDQLIAGPGDAPMVVTDNGKARLMHVSEYSNPALGRALEKASAKGKTRVTVTSEDEQWIGAFLPLGGQFSTHGWSVGVLVPEDDIIGSIKETNRIQLAVSLSILALAMLVGIGLKRVKNILDTQSRFIRRTFGRYLSDEIVTAILQSPEGLELGGEKREITMMMTDLRGFTAMSERYPPEEVVTMLNDFLGEMTEIIIKWGGTIDEFIGDAILAMFGAPFSGEDDACRAIACAVEMQLAMEKVNLGNREKGYPDLSMGIGINTGSVVVGNVGSLKRTKYGIVGQQVNLTARIESYTVGGQVLVSEATREACGHILQTGDQMEVRPKGIAEPVTIYEVLGIAGEYNVSLPEKQMAEMVRLHPALEVRYTVLEGKHSSDSMKTGYIHLINRDMYIELDPGDGRFDVHDNIKMHFSSDRFDGDCYAKVMEVNKGDKGLAILAITSLPPEIEAELKPSR